MPVKLGLVANPIIERARKGIDNEEVLLRSEDAVALHSPHSVRGSLARRRRVRKTTPNLIEEGVVGEVGRRQKIGQRQRDSFKNRRSAKIR